MSSPSQPKWSAPRSAPGRTSAGYRAGKAPPPAATPAPLALLQFNCTASNTTARFPAGTGATPCTVPWPPLMATGPLVAGPGVSQAGLSTATATSGFTTGQVEYFGHPLYTFVKDTPGTFAGEDVAAFGGIFWLVSRNGQPDAGVAKVGTEVSPSGAALSTTTASGGRTLYMLTYDTPGPSYGPPKLNSGGAAVSACTGPCSAIWPPLLTTGRPMAGPSVDPGLIGELRRPDGTTQVTYSGWPVYLYFADLAPGAPAGETNGQYLLDNNSDGVWYEVAPQGGPNPGMATLNADDGLLAVSSSAFPPSNPDATVYTLSTDTTPGTSTCTGTCARYWPPVLTSTSPLGQGLSGTLGTIQRPDGTFQVTYNGQPLYFFSQDLTSGDAGGGEHQQPLWYVLGGNPITRQLYPLIALALRADPPEREGWSGPWVSERREPSREWPLGRKGFWRQTSSPLTRCFSRASTSCSPASMPPDRLTSSG
jgi:predicted lipoprotein with Yx(FWY)xxD motif